MGITYIFSCKEVKTNDGKETVVIIEEGGVKIWKKLKRAMLKEIKKE